MTYRLRFTPSVKKQVAKLDASVANRIRRFLLQLDLDNPRSTGKALAGDEKLWRYRVGDYRILASIYDEEVLVLIVDIDHRRQVYRRK
jgi:mRNA interferase RelE/StbE